MPRIDVLPTGTSIAQPGYAFVPETRQLPQAVTQSSGGRKRAARNTGTGFGDATARQQNAILKHLAELDRDNNRDIQIPVPKDAGARGMKTTRERSQKVLLIEVNAGARGKTNTNVRRIMMSQKTFANHLADEEAALAQKTTSTTQASAQSRRTSTAEGKSALRKTAAVDDDPVEADNLLRTYVPTAPSNQVMHALTTAPPLSYNAARATRSGPRKPLRHFCEICGYWGNIKCMKCGARVCGLDCQGAHDEGRCLKFYA